eukprot:Hpha_TRINITY_DN15850_c1_g14::TRINITY_DN15850_c1_g14_i2::g.192309::m.192309
MLHLSVAMIAAANAPPNATRCYSDWPDVVGMTDPILNSVGLFYLGNTYQAGADVGEVLATMMKVRPYEEDPSSWPREFTALAERVEGYAKKSEAGGHKVSAGTAFVRASTYTRAVLHRHLPPPPYGSADPAVIRGLAEKEAENYAKYIKYVRPDIQSVSFPYLNTTLPGYLFKRNSHGPLLLVHNGRDASSEDCQYLCDAALMRGYHCLMFEGPGMGRALRLQGLPFVPEWDRVVGAAIDYVSAMPEVDSSRIGLLGASFGGALVIKAAATEHRLKAVVANPGVLNWSNITMTQLNSFLPPGVMNLLNTDPAAFDAAIANITAQSAFMKWAVEDMLYKYGYTSFAQCLLHQSDFDSASIINKVNARVLVIDGAGEVYGDGPELYKALCPWGPLSKCHKTYMYFDTQSTADLHVQAAALGKGTEDIMDWLEDNL